MIKSMTGFGKAELKTPLGIFTAEIKTLNHKFLEITPKFSNSMAVFDDRVKSILKHKIKRGKVYLNLAHDAASQGADNILINGKLAKSYCTKLKRLKRNLNLSGTVLLSDVVSFPGVINCRPAHKNTAKMWPSVREVINEALDELLKERVKEGAFLFRDFIKRMSKIKSIFAGIKRNAGYNVQSYKKSFSRKIKELSGSYPVDKGKLETEVALFAKNTDITEELTRLDNHIRNFSRTIKKRGEVGKKLDFIAQELHREINTVGSKSSGFNISKSVIEMKTEIEKIREQLKNIE